MGIIQKMGGGGGSLQVSASNVSATNSGPIGCGNPGVTGIPNLSVAGGSGNYSFAWTRVSGTPTYGPWVCSNTAAQNPVWSAPDPVCSNPGSFSEVWQCAVTDESSGQLGYASSTVIIFWTDTR